MKIMISITLTVVYITTGYDKGVELTSTQAIAKPEKLKDGSVKGEALLSIVVIFIGDLIRYSMVGVIGLIVCCKKWKAIYVGTYFWVKFISSFLNIFVSLLMMTILRLPISEMIFSLASFASDQYFCLVAYSFWQ
jgi:hypothetical protein